MNIVENSKNTHHRNAQGSSGAGGPGGASKSLFNQTHKDLKPSKSVDLSSFNNGSQTQRVHTQDDENPMNEITSSLFLMKSSEKVLQIACGSIHTVARTSLGRLFSCGNGG